MSDNRYALRSRTFLKAEIDLNGGLSTLSCIVKDLSETGARILVSEGIALPETFRIHLPKPDRWVQATVRWRRGEYIGVHFDGEQPLAVQDQSESDRIRQLEAENARLRRMLEELRNDPSRIHQILDSAA
ncbi:MAG TPA: PilZ domain-containing protein [Xanthobacteraceae bacterium]|jgi:hypothetical protein|nr:PilZ domain-containing protein [Enterovirga sp.]